MNMPHRPTAKLRQQGNLHIIVPLLFVVLFAIVGVWLLVYTHAATPTCGGDSGKSGQRVASEAERQLCIWNGGRDAYGQSISHRTQLSWITDGNVGESWCADFVSYVYKNVGRPFGSSSKYGTRNGWDWPSAVSLEHLPGFTYHTVSSGYKPKVGDIAEFNFPGGHVEIVVATNPLTFVYGNTSSGGMAKDNFTGGDVLGYVTPN